jgi:DNA-directed RNA polymerase subunit RPC12/RpoP
MRDLFYDCLYACGTIVAITATLAIVRYLGRYILERRTRQAKPVEPAPVPRPGLVPSSPPRDSEDFTVQCGRCKSPILSKPVRTEMTGEGKARLIYKCDSCGATVALKA